MAVKIKKKEMFEVNFFELNKSLNKAFNTNQGMYITQSCNSTYQELIQLCSRKMTATANVSDVVK